VGAQMHLVSSCDLENLPSRHHKTNCQTTETGKRIAQCRAKKSDVKKQKNKRVNKAEKVQFIII